MVADETYLLIIIVFSTHEHIKKYIYLPIYLIIYITYLFVVF